MRADKIHRAWRRGILSNGERDRGSLSSFFSFRLVSLVSSFAKEETREMRQRKSKRKWILKNNTDSLNLTFLLFIYNEKEIKISFKDERTTDGRPYNVKFNARQKPVRLPPGGSCHRRWLKENASTWRLLKPHVTQAPSVFCYAKSTSLPEGG